MIDYEKKYMELLGLMKGCVADENGFVHIKPYEMFPELMESNDERIRKTLLGYFKDQDAQYTFRGLTNDEVIKWLEKQKEKKPADKINPKFKIGNWIIKDNESVKYVKDIIEDNYAIDGGMNGIEFLPLKYVENNYRLWTIHDAQDGDVLAYPDGSITLFKYMVENIYMAHVLWVDGHIELNNSCAVSNVHPATKGQRELLFQKMHEVGYEWNEDKLELKKIEKEPVWSEEDEEFISEIVKDLQGLKYRDTGERAKVIYQKEIDWLKSLKDRVVQLPKPEWNEEDEFIKKELISYLIGKKSRETDGYAIWLKSLRPQNRWKPTEEQLTALDNAISGRVCDYSVLSAMWRELKELTK